MPDPLPKPIVSPEWLAAHLGAAGLVVIDASWRMPGKGDAREDYEKRHIPGAVFFPIDEIADRRTSLPHMLPEPKEFEAAVGALGVSEHDRIVVYDDQGLFSAARVWWTFRAMGHDDVAVLDGGLPRWMDEGRVVTAAAPSPLRKTYRAASDCSRVADHLRVRNALKSSDALVLDARPAGRFFGEDEEPRPGLRRGHMPGAANLPVSSIVTGEGRLKSRKELRALFQAAGALDAPCVITTCGSGVTAAALSLALEVLGHPSCAVYDGSWAEWGLETNDPEEFPVEAGAR